MSPEREALQARQDAVVAALLGDGEMTADTVPRGLDPAELSRARSVLARKRRWVEARRGRRLQRRWSERFRLWLRWL